MPINLRVTAQVQTPNMDALVAEGIELTRHYVYMSDRVFYCVIIQPSLQDMHAVAQLCAVRCGRSACGLTHVRRPAARACHAAAGGILRNSDAFCN